MRLLFLAAASMTLAACTADPSPDTNGANSAATMLIDADAERTAKEVPAGWSDFSGALFTEAQAEGRTILVDVAADWCPTCKAQAPILDELTQEEALSDALFIKVDYDRDKDFVKALRIPRQSTVLLFKGDEEVVRSIAETDREALRELFLAPTA